MTFENEKTSSGVAKAGLTTGIIGTSLAGLLGLGALGAGGLKLGSLGTQNAVNGDAAAAMMGILAAQAAGTCGCNRSCSCESDHLVTRYDADKDARIAELETQVALRDANTYTDQKALQMYQYIDGRLRSIEGQICQQAVINQATQDKFQLVQQESECCCNSVKAMIENERQARCCGDNAIVNYANATFYPQMIASITTGTTATPQATWNPVTNCGCCG